MKKIEELLAAQRELSAKMVNAEGEQYAQYEREYNANKREIEMINQQAVAERNAPKPEKKSFMAQLREAIKTNQRTITVQGYTPEGGSAVAGVHDHVIDEEYKGILEPLYTNSVLGALGVRFFSGLPQGDVKIPVMSKNTVGWESEIGTAGATGNTFTSITMKPKRLTAYVDLSKQLIMQDTIGAEQAILRDLVKAVGDKLEATIFGYDALSATQPKGMFNNKTLADAKDFKKVCEIEASLEDACVSGEMKYLLSPKAKADFRAMAKSTKNTQLVMEGGAIDGVPALVSANVKDAASTTAGAYIYGNWNNLAVASWGNVEIGIYDDSNTAVNGTVRLVVNAYFDAQVLRENAFAYGDTRHA